MLGSGEFAVTPKICLPASNFAFAVLYIFTGAAAGCCARATNAIVRHSIAQTMLAMTIRLTFMSSPLEQSLFAAGNTPGRRLAIRLPRLTRCWERRQRRRTAANRHGA